MAVIAWDSVARVEVTDRSGPGVPESRPTGRYTESGRGLGLVVGLAARWGWWRRGQSDGDLVLTVPHAVARR